MLDVGGFEIHALLERVLARGSLVGVVGATLLQAVELGHGQAGVFELFDAQVRATLVLVELNAVALLVLAVAFEVDEQRRSRYLAIALERVH